MFQNIAVIFRGHERTWRQIYKEVFDFWESMSVNVDYYYATWRPVNKNNYNMLDTFNGKNLVKFMEVWPNPDVFQAYRGPGWISYNLLPYFRERQKSVTYDAVFDTRPDILYRRKKDNNNNYLSILPPEDMCLHTSGFESGHRRNPHDENDIHKGKRSVAISDWFFMMKPNVFIELADRWTDEKMTGSQIQYREFAESRGITLCAIDWVETAIVRPFDVNSFQGRLIEDKNWQRVLNLRHEWVHMPFEKKEEILRNTGQPTEDWDTPTMRNFAR